MNNDVVKVSVLAVLPIAQDTTAVFVGNDEKCFTIHVEPNIGRVLAMALRGEKSERPLTHDLITLVFAAFDIAVDHVVINELAAGTYYARIILKAASEVHKKIIELDARPSDSLILALQAGKPIYVEQHVWAEVEDMTEFLEKMKKALLKKKADPQGPDIKL